MRGVAASCRDFASSEEAARRRFHHGSPIRGLWRAEYVSERCAGELRHAQRILDAVLAQIEKLQGEAEAQP